MKRRSVKYIAAAAMALALVTAPTIPYVHHSIGTTVSADESTIPDLMITAASDPNKVYVPNSYGVSVKYLDTDIVPSSESYDDGIVYYVQSDKAVVLTSDRRFACGKDVAAETSGNEFSLTIAGSDSDLTVTDAVYLSLPSDGSVWYYEDIGGAEFRRDDSVYIPKSTVMTLISEIFFHAEQSGTVVSAAAVNDVYKIVDLRLDADTEAIVGSLRQGQIIRTGDTIDVWNKEMYTAETGSELYFGNEPAADREWEKLSLGLAVTDNGHYRMDNDGAVIAEHTDTDAVKGIGVYVESGDGTSTAPYVFLENVKYIYTGDGSPMADKQVEDIHVGDKLYKAFSSGMPLDIDVTTSAEGMLGLRSDQMFYVKESSSSRYVGAPYHTTDGYYSYTANSIIEGISLYDPTAPSELKGTYLTLNGDIGIKFSFFFSDEDLKNDTTKVYLKFGNSEPVYYSPADGRREEVLINYKPIEVYTFDVTVSAKQMTEKVTAGWEVTTASGKRGQEMSKSVKDIAKGYLSGTYLTDVKNAVKAMLVYGGYTQNYFGHDIDDLAYSVDGVDKASIDKVTAAKLSDYAYSTADNSLPSDKITADSVSVTLDTRTALNFYMTKVNASDTIEHVSATLDGVALSDDDIKVQTSGKKVKISITGIPAEKLNTKVSLLIAVDGKLGSLSYSPMTYAYNAIRNSKQESDVMKAFYLYHEACKRIPVQ